MATMFANAIPGPRVATGGELARLRIRLSYAWRHRRLPDLDAPRRFTEWVQWRKINERSPALARLTDKVASKALVASRLGAHWVVPTLWHGEVAPDIPPWPVPFVIKASHGCNQYAIVHDVARDWPEARARSRRWTRQTYGRWLDEWLYSLNRPGLLVEPFIGHGSTPPADYKLYVFAGCVAVVQVHTGRLGDHRWVQYDREWRRLSNGADAPPPASLTEMIQAAEVLGRTHDFLRVDFYDTPAGPLFGEFCLYPGSGLDPFDPPLLDDALGARWSAARKALAKD